MVENEWKRKQLFQKDLDIHIIGREWKNSLGQRDRKYQTKQGKKKSIYYIFKNVFI